MLYKNFCGINLNLIRVALFIGVYDIFGTLTLIILNIEFFAPSKIEWDKVLMAFFPHNVTDLIWLNLYFFLCVNVRDCDCHVVKIFLSANEIFVVLI